MLHTDITTSIWCSMSSTDIEALKFRIKRFIHSISCEPKPPAGSSNIKIFGSLTSARAIATRFVSGYDNVSARRLAKPPAYTRSRALNDFVRISFSSLPLRPNAAESNPEFARWCAPTITFSRTVKSPNKPTPCNVREIPKSTKFEVRGKS